MPPPRLSKTCFLLFVLYFAEKCSVRNRPVMIDGDFSIFYIFFLTFSLVKEVKINKQLFTINILLAKQAWRRLVEKSLKMQLLNLLNFLFQYATGALIAP